MATNLFTGVNTGFGFFANKSISHDQLVKVQDNIIQSHAAGFGPALSVEETRLAMALRLHVLLKGCNWRAIRLMPGLT